MDGTSQQQGHGPGPAPGRLTGVVDESVHQRACPALRESVAWYSGYRQAGLPPALHRGLPSPYLTLIFTLDDPLTLLRHPDPRQAPGDYSTLLGGLHTTPALIAHEGSQSGIEVALAPLGARTLLGLPAGELAGLDLPADAVLGRLAAEIQERVQAAPSWQRRFQVLDELLLRQAQLARAPARTPAPEVARAWRVLLSSGGTAPAAALAAEVGWSGRHLADRFQEHIGLTPKSAARVVRFDRARRMLPGRQRLADVAATCGYYDQAHLSREFHALAGCSPSDWLAAENPRDTDDPGSEMSKPSATPPGETGPIAGGTTRTGSH